MASINAEPVSMVPNRGSQILKEIRRTNGVVVVVAVVEVDTALVVVAVVAAMCATCVPWGEQSVTMDNTRPRW